MPLDPRRDGKITASFAPALMAGQDDEIFAKWLELIGDPSWVPPDYDYDWPVKWGQYGEPFILDWHQRKTKYPIERRQEFVQHPTLPYVSCTLDGHRAFDDTVIDAKVCGAHIPLDDLLSHYAPQLVVQRACVQSARAALLLVHGSSSPVEYPLEVNLEYERLVWERIAEFKYCVDNMIEPVVMPRIVPPEKWRTIDLDGPDATQFNWASDMCRALEDWGALKEGADEFDEVVKDIKKLLPDDVGVLSFTSAGGALTVKRNRANAVSIRFADAARRPRVDSGSGQMLAREHGQ